MTKRQDQLQTKNFWVAAGWRSLRTFAQSILSLISVNATDVLSTSAQSILLTSIVAALISVLTSIVAGIPEAPSPDPMQGPESITNGGTHDDSRDDRGTY